jgi:hypothetical protein
MSKNDSVEVGMLKLPLDKISKPTGDKVRLLQSSYVDMILRDWMTSQLSTHVLMLQDIDHHLLGASDALKQAAQQLSALAPLLDIPSPGRGQGQTVGVPDATVWRIDNPVYIPEASPRSVWCWCKNCTIGVVNVASQHASNLSLHKFSYSVQGRCVDAS